MFRLPTLHIDPALLHACNRERLFVPQPCNAHQIVSRTVLSSQKPLRCQFFIDRLNQHVLYLY